MCQEGLRDYKQRSSPSHMETASPQKTTVTQVREVTAGYLMKCSAFSTPEEAAYYRGAWIQIPMQSRSP